VDPIGIYLGLGDQKRICGSKISVDAHVHPATR
jgi:hypothetical protein